MPFNLPTIFQSPYDSNKAPVKCCCPGGGKVEVNITPIGSGVSPMLTVSTRSEDAARLIAEANKRGFKIFQGV